MNDVQRCLDNPAQHDVPLGQIFTPKMFQELMSELANHGTPNLGDLESVWCQELASRKSITEYLKDQSLGEKRLISMPDRMTSTLKSVCGDIIFRPTPISGSQEDMGDPETWWTVWRRFMFGTAVNVRGCVFSCPFLILQTIPRAKYPALSEAEEALSVPLQALCLALFDVVLVHLLSSVMPAHTWQPLKWSLHRALYEDKEVSCVGVLKSHYPYADIIFVQEASEKFAARAWACLEFCVLRPARSDGRRSQMSVIMLRLERFIEASARDLTCEVLELLPSKCVEKGDLCVFQALSHDGRPFLLASFHGDSGGRATCPVVSAIHRLAQEHYQEHTIILGLDANTAARRSKDAALDVAEFLSFLSARGLSSCWTGRPLDGVWTTFSARTHLQPQLHKAVSHARVLESANTQLKDWIVFAAAQAESPRPSRIPGRIPAQRASIASWVRTLTVAAQGSDRLRRRAGRVPRRGGGQHGPPRLRVARDPVAGAPPPPPPPPGTARFPPCQRAHGIPAPQVQPTPERARALGVCHVPVTS